MRRMRSAKFDASPSSSLPQSTHRAHAAAAAAGVPRQSTTTITQFKFQGPHPTIILTNFNRPAPSSPHSRVRHRAYQCRAATVRCR